MRFWSAKLSLTLVGLGLVAACANDKLPDKVELPSAREQPTTTTIATATTVDATTTTTTQPQFAFTLTGLTLPPSPVSGSNSGSGCSPGSTTALPDGIWLVTIPTVGANTMDLDLACHNSDSGQVINDNDLARVHRIHEAATIVRPDGTLDTVLSQIDPGQLQWVAINGGAVTQIAAHPS